jgi:hypothetical protein
MKLPKYYKKIQNINGNRKNKTDKLYQISRTPHFAETSLHFAKTLRQEVPSLSIISQIIFIQEI